MKSRFPTLAATLLILLWAAACTEVKQGIDEASESLDSLFGTDEQPQEAAASEQSSAEVKAAAFYRNGMSARERGVETQAFLQLLKAAELGHVAAAYEAGLAYKDGRGTDKDLEAGAKWINTAADRGDARAQYLIGFTHYTGTGGKRNYELAVLFLAQAAGQGHAQAQHLLAQAFANGRGVAKNATRAARWYGKAAAQGLADAQFSYGVVRASGLGLPKSRVRGYTWLLLAQRNGHKKAAKVRAALDDKMSPAQLARATVNADDFKPVSAPPFADPPTIMYVEQRLNRLGFDAGPVDGKMGKRTRAAITKYQQSRSLAENGQVSPELLDRLATEKSGNS